jgi:hypothetical protein
VQPLEKTNLRTVRRIESACANNTTGPYISNTKDDTSTALIGECAAVFGEILEMKVVLGLLELNVLGLAIELHGLTQIGFGPDNHEARPIFRCRLSGARLKAVDLCKQPKQIRIIRQ